MALHHTACQAMQKTATYWHMLPAYAQGRKAIWEAVNPHSGKRRIDEAFPPEIRKRTDNQSMAIELVNGSFWHVVGSDNYNSLVGTPPYGIVCSEWALADPAAWAYLRPILDENGGWAVFIFTSRGRNHGYSLYEMAKRSDAWFAQLLTADDTDVFTPEQLSVAKAELTDIYGPIVGSAVYDQEYFCSFTAAVLGSFYGAQLEKAEKDGRICELPYNPNLRVTTAWDIGAVNTAIWFVQQDGFWTHWIDYYDPTVDDYDFAEEGLPRLAKIFGAKGYVYDRHIVPHDIMVGEFGGGVSRVESADKLGLKLQVAPRLSVDDGIHAVRKLLPFSRFDSKRCRRGLEALANYRVNYDEKRRTFMDTPVKDWATHGADAARYYAVTPERVAPPKPPIEVRQFFRPSAESHGWMG